MRKLNHFFERRISYAPLILRVIAGWRLISPSLEYVNGKRSMTTFRDLLAALHFPFPLVSAYVSIAAQLIGGLLILVGCWTRPAALVLTINFLIIVLTAHLHDPIVKSFPAWALLAMAAALLFTGAGKLSVDGYRQPGKKFKK